MCVLLSLLLFLKQKTAYEMRISDWSSDVCSSDLFATRWAAAELAYQPELGPPWFFAFGRPIYLPWALFGWWFSFDAYAPKVFDEAGAIAARSEERRVGSECVSTCSSGGSAYH